MTPPCTFLLAALLVVVASAQWPGLPKIDPGHVAGVVRTAGKEVKQTLSQKQDLRSQATSVAQEVAQSTAQAASASVQTAEAAKATAGDAQSQQQVLASQVAKEAKHLRAQTPVVSENVVQNAATSVSMSAQTAKAAKAIAGDAQPQQQVLTSPAARAAEAKHLRSQAPSVAENVAQSAAQAVSMSAQTAKAAKAIAGDEQVLTSPAAEAAEAEHRRSQATSVAENVVQSAAQAISMSAQTAKAANAIAGNAQSQQQVGAIGGPTALNPSKVTRGVSKVVASASMEIEAANPMIHEVSKSDLKHVAHAAGMPATPDVAAALAAPAMPVVPTAPVAPFAPGPVVLATPAPVVQVAKGEGKYINGDHPEEGEQASDVDQGVKESRFRSTHWKWSLLFIVGALGLLVFGGQVAKHRAARSPTLLPDSEMPDCSGEPRSRKLLPESNMDCNGEFVE